MFAHLRSKNTVLARYQFLPKHIAIKMRDNVRNSLGLPWQLNAGIGAETGGMADYVTDAGVGEYGLLDYQGDEYIDGVADYVTDANV